MNLLLDTHIALWAITDSPRLSKKARDMIQAPAAKIWISTVSLWEISIKYSLGRGDMPITSTEALGYFHSAGYQMLSIEPEHAIAVEALPLHHQDPFDLLLVAQAQVEPMLLLTDDSQLLRYGTCIIAV